MKNEEYAKIVSKNLKRLAFVADKTQADISRELKIPKASISAWMNGTRVPKIETIGCMEIILANLQFPIDNQCTLIYTYIIRNRK